MTTATTKPLLPGQPCWNEVPARDPDATAAFYTALLSWTTEEALMDGATYTFFMQDEYNVAGMMSMVGDQWPADIPSHWMSHIRPTTSTQRPTKLLRPAAPSAYPQPIFRWSASASSLTRPDRRGHMRALHRGAVTQR